MSNNDEETFWVLEENDAFIARKVSGRNFRFKKRKGKGKSGNKKGSHQRGGSNPFEKAVLAGRPVWPMRTMIPTTRRIGEKAKERRERKAMEEHPATQQVAELQEPAYAGWTDQDF